MVRSCFTNAQEALKYFKDHSGTIDMLVTDMTMPKMTGIEVSRKIFEIRPELPIVICTGYSESVNDEVIF